MSGLKRVDLLIQAVVIAAGHLADCKTRESELDFARQQEKQDAMSRVLGVHATSVTKAAEVVNLDEQFATFEVRRRYATAKTIRAMGEYEAAKLRAAFAVAGADLSIIDDETLPLGLGADHTVQVG